jgi:hypothetical protein
MIYVLFFSILQKFLNGFHFPKKMKRGRPVRSDVRQNIVNILSVIKEGYGYEIYRIYKGIFPSCTMRLIYYHLKKGIETGEIKIKDVRKEKGNFSWGGEVEKTYYCLGENASPRNDERIKSAFEKIKNQRNL